jgi:hypothetical protein
MRRVTGVAVVLSVLLPALPSSAQVSAGSEFRANTYTFSEQARPSVAADSAGNFLVLWQSFTQDGSGTGVFGQRYDASGSARGTEFRVNTYTLGYQQRATAAFDGGGNFVIVWTSTNQDGDLGGIFGQRYDATGASRGVEFRVNAQTTGSQEWPSVASDAAGHFVVVWRSSVGDGDNYGVFARRFDAAGAPLGGDFQVNTYTSGYQISLRQSVAMDAAGNFVVVWHSERGDGSTSGAFGQLFDASGARHGAEFIANTYTTGAQSHPTVAMDAAGNFVVAWESLAQDGSGPGIFAQRYDPAGTRRGGEFRVNTFTTDYQRQLSVASDALGNFLVTWNSRTQDGLGEGVFAQRFASSGAPRGAEFRVNSYTVGNQYTPFATMDAVGNMTVVWASFLQDGASWGAYGQRLGGLKPAALAVDPTATAASNGNSILEPGETADVQPSWLNVNGASQAFGGSATSFTGPSAAGVTYSLPDAAADYGAVANGISAPCVDCYRATVGFTGTRPALHWDATLTETIVPDAHGQVKPWTVHVGASFADVSTASGFYRFIEALLHNGVTGGCTGTTYCPASAVSREEMAVFALVAKEGAGYVPPDCTTPAFGDVAPGSPFCRWIEELSRRGVVAGCGGGNYCPAAAVTREQMPIFMLRTLDPAINPAACGLPMFTDVPASSPFCRWIEELARRHVVSGCGGGAYCPASPVTREQMAVFISVTFGLSLYGP